MWAKLPTYKHFNENMAVQVEAHKDRPSNENEHVLGG